MSLWVNLICLPLGVIRSLFHRSYYFIYLLFRKQGSLSCPKIFPHELLMCTLSLGMFSFLTICSSGVPFILFFSLFPSFSIFYIHGNGRSLRKCINSGGDWEWCLWWHQPPMMFEPHPLWKHDGEWNKSNITVKLAWLSNTAIFPFFSLFAWFCGRVIKVSKEHYAFNVATITPVNILLSAHN